MKKAFHITSILAMATIAIGCASTKAYFIDRGRDAMDVVTLTAGTGIGGVKVKAGPLVLGAYQSRDLAGIKGREAFAFPDPQHAGWDAWFVYPIIPLDWGNMSGVEMWDGGDRAFTRGKNIGYLSPYPFWTGGLAERGWASPYPYQIDASVGLGLTVRLGLNPAELLDFLFGWFTIDIFNDDLESTKLKGKSNQRLERTGVPPAAQP